MCIVIVVIITLCVCFITCLRIARCVALHCYRHDHVPKICIMLHCLHYIYILQVHIEIVCQGPLFTLHIVLQYMLTMCCVIDVIRCALCHRQSDVLAK